MTTSSIPAGIRHRFYSPMPDGPNPNVVRPSDWNATHEVEAGGLDHAYHVGNVGPDQHHPRKHAAEHHYGGDDFVGVEVVAALPSEVVVGRLVLLATDGHLYIGV